MALRLEPFEWIWRAGLLSGAAFVGLVAGYAPLLAIAAVVGIAFAVISLADLRIGLALFVLIAFLETGAVLPGIGLAKVAGAAIALSWLALVLTDAGSRRLIWKDHPALTAVLCAFLAWILLSVSWAGDPSQALGSSAQYLLNAALLPIVYTAVRSPADLKLIVGAFVLGAGMAAVLGLFASPDPIASDSIERLTSTIGDPNELAATLAAGFMLSIGLSITRPPGSWSRWTLRAVGALCVISLLLTVSRGGAVALAAALVIAPLIARNRIRAVAAVVAVVALAAIYLASLAPAGTMERLVDRDGGSGRTDIWKVATRMVDARPVFGFGVGNFPSASVDYVIQAGALPDKRTLISQPTVAHNMYLEVWAEAGLIGLFLFSLLLASCLQSALVASRRFRERGDPGTAALAGGIALALIALMTAYFFLSEQTGNKFWILIALCPALGSLARQKALSPRSSS